LFTVKPVLLRLIYRKTGIIETYLPYKPVLFFVFGAFGAFIWSERRLAPGVFTRGLN
jgi:hypothetical protein